MVFYTTDKLQRILMVFYTTDSKLQRTQLELTEVN